MSENNFRSQFLRFQIDTQNGIVGGCDFNYELCSNNKQYIILLTIHHVIHYTLGNTLYFSLFFDKYKL